MPKKWTGVTLITITGLLNFHIPHFFIELNQISGASRIVELLFVANLLGALIAAIGIHYQKRWGWLLGVVVCVLSASLWLAQETIGLAGLPQQWLEPSRLVSLLVEIVFVIIAWRYLRRSLN